VIAEQQRWLEGVFARDPAAVAVVESALIFEVERDARARGEQEGALAGTPGDRSWSSGLLADWRNRFDHIIVLTAPDEVKITRYAARAAMAGSDREAAVRDARVRLARQIPDAEKAARADFIIENTGDLAGLRGRVESVWEKLKAESNTRASGGSLE